MVLEWVLKQNGIEPFRDVKIITSLAFAAAPGAFAAGTGDYIAQFEPAMTQLEMEGHGRIVKSMGLEGGEITYTVYHVRKSQLARDRDMLVRFTRALYKGMRWVESHTPMETASVIFPFFPDTDVEVIARIVERYKTQGTWNATPEISEKGFAHLQEVMASACVLHTTAPFDALMTNTIARAALGVR
jgi:NitT/TauT family transport system substrate-binding protein